LTTGAPADLLTADETVIAGVSESEAKEITARSPLQLFWRRLRKDRVAMGALTFIAVLCVVAVLAPLIVDLLGAPEPNERDAVALDEFGLPDTSTADDPQLGSPTSDHLFGVDQIGRDVFSRTLYGARVSLEVALIATAASVFVGVTLGMIAGYFRGWVDAILSRIMDVQLESFPPRRGRRAPR
jgi:ABC-type dipeptide/oligopeptide/nickel transport system permease subunit